MQYPPTRALNKKSYGKMVLDVAQGDRRKAEWAVNSSPQDDDQDPVRAPAAEMSDRELCHDLVDAHVHDGMSDRRGIAPDFASRMLQELDINRAATAFALAGRRIVQFDAALTSEFANTDLGDTRPSDIKLPWDAFFIAFHGPDEPWAVDRPVRGYMVVREEAGIDPDGHQQPTITITPMGDVHRDWTHGPFHRMKGAWMDADGDGTLDHALFGRTNHNALENSGVADGEKYKDPVLRERVQSVMDEASDGSGGMLRNELGLVGNALLYLSLKPDMQETWQNGAPAKLVEKAAGHGRQGEKAVREIVYAGWSRVHYVGLDDAKAHGETGGVRPHWRRGHWRRQPCGTGRREIKLVRIRPTVVGGTAQEANRTGRVVAVEGQSAA